MGYASRSSLLTLVVCCLPLGAALPLAAMPQDLRIEGVTIVSPERASPMRNADVYRRLYK